MSLVVNDLLAAVRVTRVRAEGGRFARYRDDPVAFAKQVLKVRQLWSRQIELLEALAVHDKVTCRSGNGVGKTITAAIAALWFWSTRGRGSRVFLTSSKGDQTEKALWKEIRGLYLLAGGKEALGGLLPKLGKTGLAGDEEQEILVLTGDKAEAFAGLRAPEMLLIADEASGIEERIFEAMVGNLSGDGKWLLIGNPMQPSGYFFKSHQDSSDFYRMHISALESPNVVEGRTVIKGLSTRRFVESCKADFGEDSALYRIRVLGEFIKNEAGKPIPWIVIGHAQERWASTKGEGVLSIGLDPAGPGRAGDDSCIVAVRGQRMLDCVYGPTWDDDAIIRHTLDKIQEHRVGDEIPRLVIDAGGPIGGRIYGRFCAIRDTIKDGFKRFTVHAVRADQKAQREPTLFTRVRDELFENLARWIKGGGAIIPGEKLAVELHAPVWLATLDGRLKLTDKDQVRKEIGRSPDRADALALAVWLPSWSEEAPLVPAQAVRPATQNPYRTGELQDQRGQGLYGSLDWARPKR